MANEIAKKKVRRREKSVRYPYYDLEDSLEFAKIVDKIAGKKDAPILAILDHMGIKSENNKQLNYKISSSEQFGLISKHNRSLAVTELARNIFFPPRGESQELQLLLEAFRSPPLYRKIIEQYEGRGLPETLPNILYTFGVAQNKIKRAAKVFRESALFAHALDEDDRLRTTNIEAQESVTSETALGPTETQQTQVDVTSRRYHDLSVSLSSGETLKLSIPASISRQDVEKIKKMLDVLVGG